MTGYARPIVTVSRHDLATIWVAFFSRCQRYRCSQDHNFGWGQLGNSLLTAGTTPAGIFTTIYVSRLPRPVEKGGKNYKDRNCICVAQSFIGPGLALMMYFWGCSDLQPATPDVAAAAALEGHPAPDEPRLNDSLESQTWFVVLCLYYQATFAAQVPSNIAIYSKLLGQHHMSVFMAILQMLMGIARLSASYFVGWAYYDLGPCALWASSLIFWAFQFLPFFCVWTAWDVPSMTALHAKIDAEIEADADAELYTPAELARRRRAGGGGAGGLDAPLMRGME